MTRHPLSAAWPDMPPGQFDELVADVRANGIRQPIIAIGDQVLDGWHRYQAALLAEEEFRVIEFEGDDAAAAALVISRNAHRRHLSPRDRADAIVATQRAAGMEWAKRGDRREPGAEGSPDPSAIRHEQIATDAGVSKSTARRAVRDAKAAEEKVPKELMSEIDELQADLEEINSLLSDILTDDGKQRFPTHPGDAAMIQIVPETLLDARRLQAALRKAIANRREIYQSFDEPDPLSEARRIYARDRAKWKKRWTEEHTQRIAAEEAAASWKRAAEGPGGVSAELERTQLRVSVLESRLAVALKDRRAEMRWRKALQKKLEGGRK